MANSIREQIILAAKAALAAGTPPGAVYRSRTAPFAAAELPAFNLYPQDEKNSEKDSGHGEVQRILVLRVSCEVKAVDQSQNVDSLLDPLLQWAVNKLTTDAALANLVLRVSELSTEWSIEAGDQDIAAGIISFEIEYFTSRTDLTVSAA